MKQTHVIAIAAVAVVLLVGGYFLVQTSKKTVVPDAASVPVTEDGEVPMDAPEQAEAPIAPPTSVEVVEDIKVESYDAALAKAKNLDQKFEVILNGMLKEIKLRADQYTKERKVMLDLTSPDNIRDPKYVEENFELMQQTVPRLQVQTQRIMAVFDKAERDVEQALAKESAATRDELLAKWNATKAENLGAYHRFFELEGELIRAHERLMRFYFVKRNHYKVNTETDEVVFTNPGDQLLARNLRMQVTRLEAAQKQGVAAPAPVTPPEAVLAPPPAPVETTAPPEAASAPEAEQAPAAASGVTAEDAPAPVEAPAPAEEPAAAPAQSVDGAEEAAE